MHATFLSVVLLGFAGVVHMEDCPRGFEKFTNGKCYLFVKGLRTHPDAEVYCATRGGYLAEPRTKEENKFIAERIRGRAYIGCKYDSNEENFVGGYTKKPVSYTNWLEGEPGDGYRDGEFCVAINYPQKENALWSGITCEKPFFSVCEYYNYCPKGWSQHYNKCYFAAKNEKTWLEAQASCARRDAILPEPRNEKENVIVASFYFGKRQWLGLTEEEGSFVWASDKEKPCFTNWIGKKPTNLEHGGDKCVQVIDFAKWDDSIECGERRNFVCVRNL